MITIGNFKQKFKKKYQYMYLPVIVKKWCSMHQNDSADQLHIGANTVSIIIMIHALIKENPTIWRTKCLKQFFYWNNMT